MKRKVLVTASVVGALLFSLWSAPSVEAAGVGCSGRCLLHYTAYSVTPYCSLSVFGQVICFTGPDWCAEFACPESVALTSPGSPAESSAMGTALLPGKPEPAQPSSLGEPKVEQLGPRY